MHRQNRVFATIIAIVLGILVCGPSVRALTFNISYDPAMTNQTEFPAVRAAIDYTTREYTNLFTNNVTVNIQITADLSSNPDFLGYSIANYFSSSYSQIRTALLAHAVSAADRTAYATLPATDPTGGGAFELTTAEAKTLGLLASSSASDGTFGFALYAGWTYDPTNRAVANVYDFIGTAEHEFSEIMGRQGDIGYVNNSYQPYDLFRYSAAGVRSLDSNATNAYFSIDGGTNLLKLFGGITDGDDFDWYLISDPPDSFDAEGPPNADTPMMPIDLEVMDVLGYTLNTTPPKIMAANFLPDHTFNVSGTGIVSQTYILLATTNANSSAGWTPVATNFAVLNGNFNFTDPQAPNFRTRFYRVVSP